MVELHKNNYTTSQDFVVVESNRQSIAWFNPIRYTMALLALISAVSAVTIIVIIGPGHHQFLALIISLCVSLMGITGSLRCDLTLSGLYCALMAVFLVIQCRYYHSHDPGVLSLTVPMLGWAAVNSLSSFARLFLQLLHCIASTAFLYGLWINTGDKSRDRTQRFVLSRL
jgi:hypothetical protein